MSSLFQWWWWRSKDKRNEEEWVMNVRKKEVTRKSQSRQENSLKEKVYQDHNKVSWIIDRQTENHAEMTGVHVDDGVGKKNEYPHLLSDTACFTHLINQIVKHNFIFTCPALRYTLCWCFKNHGCCWCPDGTPSQVLCMQVLCASLEESPYDSNLSWVILLHLFMLSSLGFLVLELCYTLVLLILFSWFSSSQVVFADKQTASHQHPKQSSCEEGFSSRDWKSKSRWALLSKHKSLFGSGSSLLFLCR